MILSIDNKKPTIEELEKITNSVCIKCKQPFTLNYKRIIFVETDKKFMWWHGYNIPKHNLQYLCSSTKTPFFVESRRCRTCLNRFKSKRRVIYCSTKCEQEFHKKFA